MIEKPADLKLRQKYLMQIISAQSEYQDRIPYSRYRFEFGIRVWPDIDDLDTFYDLAEVFYNSGRCADYLVDFIEIATDCEYCEYNSDVNFTVGAAFVGVITAKVKYDRWGDIDKTFYNVEAIEPLGYYDVENADDIDDESDAQ